MQLTIAVFRGSGYVDGTRFQDQCAVLHGGAKQQL